MISMSTTNVILIIYLTTFDRILKTSKMKKILITEFHTEANYIKSQLSFIQVYSGWL